MTDNAGEYRLFFQASGKADNDATNARREKYLALLHAMVITETDPEQLKHLHASWRSALDLLAPAGCKLSSVHHAGGRSMNYDYLVEYTGADDGSLHRQKVEFKYGAASIEKLPQFLSMASVGIHFPVSYAEYYYDTYINKYCAIDDGIGVSPPPREQYLAWCHSSNYDRHPFFRQIYTRDCIMSREKHALVNDSIRTYLATYGHLYEPSQLSELLVTKQDGKAFLMWDKKSFHVATLSREDLTPVRFAGIKRGNTIMIETATKLLLLLLRWKNHKGVLYPAWQISLRPK
jgi:hypothetical protein